MPLLMPVRLFSLRVLAVAVFISQTAVLTDAFFSSVLTQSASLFNTQTVHPDLSTIVDAQHETVLQIALDIGGTGDASRMGINGLTLQLHSDRTVEQGIKLPGVNGPHPQLSSGSRRLTIQQAGGFVSLDKGARTVDMMHPCWELVWKDEAPAGTFVCGFDVPDDYRRNDATLPKGQLYISFPVWTTDGLLDGRRRKERALGYLKQKMDALERFRQEPNPITKALQYREACLAAEKCSLYPIQNYDIVPDENETVELLRSADAVKKSEYDFDESLWLATRGIVWSKDLPRGPKMLLGSARIVKSSSPAVSSADDCRRGI